MTRSIARLVVFAGALSFGACVHASEQEKAKASYEATANTRISTMQKHIDALDKKAAEQLPGEPKMELTQAIDTLKQSTKQAQTALTQLDQRDPSTWVNGKSTVDQKLFDMDQAYSNALQVLQAH